MKDLELLILESVNAKQLIKSELVQELWSGYGEIRRYWLEDGNADTVIVKHVQLPEHANHPRGWDTDLSHQRKLKSYQIEMGWYTGLGAKAHAMCRIPKLYYADHQAHEMLLIMEDLDSSGFPVRRNSVNKAQIQACLQWLAHFHAKYMNTETDQLWGIGSYWHLATRPDELGQMKNHRLKSAASKIDNKLNSAQYQTLIHGDAKLANFCFSETDQVAAVDFQYIGKSCGMKDVAYFMSSCLSENECKNEEEDLLNFYFKELKLALIESESIKLAIIEEWRELYKYAWADFYRFLDGWSPGHWKMHEYSHSLTEQVLQELGE